MEAKKKKILFISGGVLTTGAIVTTVLLIRRRNRRKRGLLPPSGSGTGASNILTTNNNALPPDFQNWEGGNTYMFNAPRGIRNNNPGRITSYNVCYTKLLRPYCPADADVGASGAGCLAGDDVRCSVGGGGARIGDRTSASGRRAADRPWCRSGG